MPVQDLENLLNQPMHPITIILLCVSLVGILLPLDKITELMKKREEYGGYIFIYVISVVCFCVTPFLGQWLGYVLFEQEEVMDIAVYIGGLISAGLLFRAVGIKLRYDGMMQTEENKVEAKRKTRKALVPFYVVSAITIALIVAAYFIQ